MPSLFSATRLSRIIQDGFTSGFLVGVSSGTENRTQVVIQTLDKRTGPVGLWARLNTLRTPLAADSKLDMPRRLMTTSYGRICAADTPEVSDVLSCSHDFPCLTHPIITQGHQVGLVERMAVMAEPSFGYRGAAFSSVLRCVLREAGVTHQGVDDISVAMTDEGGVLYVNGQPRLCVNNVLDARDAIVQARRSGGSLPPSLGVFIKTRCGISELHAVCDDGRLLRPLFVAEAWSTIQALASTVSIGNLWSTLTAAGCVEFLGGEEEFSSCTVATSWSEVDPSIHTHVEVHPGSIYGVAALSLPLSNMNVRALRVFVVLHPFTHSTCHPARPSYVLHDQHLKARRVIHAQP